MYPLGIGGTGGTLVSPTFSVDALVGPASLCAETSLLPLTRLDVFPPEPDNGEGVVEATGAECGSREVGVTMTLVVADEIRLVVIISFGCIDPDGAMFPSLEGPGTTGVSPAISIQLVYGEDARSATGAGWFRRLV
jgi:hypothetical protein